MDTIMGVDIMQDTSVLKMGCVQQFDDRDDKYQHKYQRRMLLDDQIFDKQEFYQFLNQKWYQALDEVQPISLIFANLNFVDINDDEYEQVSAGNCLRSIAQIICSSVYRSSDLVCRFRSEEFGIILPNTPVSGAQHVATRIQTALRNSFLDRSLTLANFPVELKYGICGLIPSRKIKLSEFLETTKIAFYTSNIYVYV
jgi:diguanylate cyclase (GGDEF)-like protein